MICSALNCNPVMTLAKVCSISNRAHNLEKRVLMVRLVANNFQLL